MVRNKTDQFPAQLNGNRFVVSADIYAEDIYITLDDLIGESMALPISKEQALEFAKQIIELCED